MQLTLWTYEGPPHIGAMRIATAMRGLHYVLHAPQGDTYADLLFTMIERRDHRPPVTYSTFQARDLGSDTAELFKNAAREAFERFRPEAMIVGASCTAELIQDDPGGLAQALDLPVPVVPLELPAYQRKENWGASETFYQLVRAMCSRTAPPAGTRREVPVGRRATCNILGPTALGFRHRDDLREVRRILERMGVEVNVVAPWGASPNDLAQLGEADFNVVLVPEVAASAAQYLQRVFGQPMTRTIPIGVGATREFIAEVAALAGVDPRGALEDGSERSSWYARSVDSTYLTGKRVFVFGDATHAVAAARVAAREFGFEVVGLGTYSREFARDVREAAKLYGVEPLITDDYLEVEAKVAELQPELVLGTQMERHIAKRLGIPCAVISAPMHVQDFPARHAPQMGFEGANVLFDTWVHPLMMGLEEHLLTMFRGDFEFHDSAPASHLGSAKSRAAEVAPQAGQAGAGGLGDEAGEAGRQTPADAGLARAGHMAAEPIVAEMAESSNGPAPVAALASPARGPAGASWAADAERELQKIPFFVRGKARRNTERFALEKGLATITVDTLYDAKAHYSR
jgi:light-independent protochlorophyllide reductase subunit B